MTKKFTHLLLAERERIYQLRRADFSYAKTAFAFGRAQRTIDTEFARHEAIAETLNAKIYFAHPYSSWERGLNENTNGLLRQYFPKGSDLRQATPEKVPTVTDLLNHRPRKKLSDTLRSNDRGHKIPCVWYSD